MSGVKLAISYGYVPCKLGLCGPQEKKKKELIARYLKGNDKLEGKIKNILKEFKGAYPYYRLIARANKISNPFNFKVVEAYWVGNDLLEKVSVAAFGAMIKKDFVPLGKVSTEMIAKLPKNALPYHNFHVLFIGSVTGKLDATQAAQDACRVSWGEVAGLRGKELMVKRRSLKFGKKIALGKTVLKKINWNKEILPEIKKGDHVSIHWNTAIAKLNSAQLKNIIRYTKRIF